MNLRDLSFDNSWTLFLDRDGVINQRIIGGYVKDWNEFIFLDGVLRGLHSLSSVFGRIIVVSNQQGIAKGLVGYEQVGQIHEFMVENIEKTGGRIDKVYVSPYLEHQNHPDRKPGIGMALKAKKDFPEIRFEKSLMAGDSQVDIEFGKNAGMYTVLIGSDQPWIEPAADFYFDDLDSLAEAIISINDPKR